MVYAQNSTVLMQPNVHKELGWSAGLHIMLVVAGMLYLPLPDKIIVPDAALPVDFITIEDFTRLTTPQEEPQEQEPEKEPQKQQESTPEPLAASQPASQPASQSVVEQSSDAMPALENAKAQQLKTADRFVNLVAAPRPLRRPLQRPALVPARPQPKRKTLLDTSRVRALLDKTPDEIVKAPNLTQANLPQGEAMSLSEIDAFRVQMQKCWSVPAGAANADNLSVRIRVGLTRNGAIAFGPYVLDKSRISDPYFRAAAESVLRAIRRCQPFQMPAEKYNRWRELELNFDPKQMLRG